MHQVFKRVFYLVLLTWGKVVPALDFIKRIDKIIHVYSHGL